MAIDWRRLFLGPYADHTRRTGVGVRWSAAAILGEYDDPKGDYDAKRGAAEATPPLPCLARPGLALPGQPGPSHAQPRKYTRRVVKNT
jgi:hypothetical protein